MTEQPQSVALITGAAQRIGAVLAKNLHQAGFCVVVHYLTSESPAIELVTALNLIRKNSALALQADFCSPSAPGYLIEQTITQWGRLDLLINNASIFSRRDTKAERMWQCNVHSPYTLSRLAYPYLKITKGNIINITDTHARTPLRDYPTYCQTKAALAMQTLVLAQEFAPEVRVNAIAPGAILWPEKENQLSAQDREEIIAKTRLKRHGSPENIAQAMLYLIQNTYVTGQCLNVDGGRYICI